MNSELVASDKKKERRRRKRQRQRSKIKKIITQEKLKPCTDCGQNWPGHMSFDHLPQFIKSQDVSCFRGSMGQFLLEMAKCQIVCCSCHDLREKARRVNGNHQCVTCRALNKLNCRPITLNK